MYVLYWIDWSVCATLASLSLLCKAWDRLAKLGARLSKRVSLLMSHLLRVSSLLHIPFTHTNL